MSYAFPQTLEAEYSGLTIRQYFAAKAMVAIIIANKDELTAANVAVEAFHFADAMIKVSDGE